VERRSAQTVLYELTDSLLRLMAPVLSFTASEAWAFLPPMTGRESEVALAAFPDPKPEWERAELDRKWERLLQVRGEITKVLEQARQEKIIGHPLEAEVVFAAESELKDFLLANLENLKTAAIVSELKMVDTPPAGGVAAEELPGLTVLVRPAPGGKCERCWTRAVSVGENIEHPQLCDRCVGVVEP
jgi:isoleucyl-tRNA synthetase